jgi:hypothetical protein
MWVFVQEFAAELYTFLSPVKIIFQTFSFFFKDIVADLAVRYTLCAHCMRVRVYDTNIQLTKVRKANHTGNRQKFVMDTVATR